MNPPPLLLKAILLGALVGFVGLSAAEPAKDDRSLGQLELET